MIYGGKGGGKVDYITHEPNLETVRTFSSPGG